MPKKIRAIATTSSPDVGMARYLLYREALKRIDAATTAGFFLEAITLLEGIISDRLESRASYLTGSNVGFQNLGMLISILRKHELLVDFKSVIEQIDKWRDARNHALHEMVKFASGERPSWEGKTGPLPSIVDEGKRVLRLFDAIDKRERRSTGEKPAATKPAALEEDYQEPSVS